MQGPGYPAGSQPPDPNVPQPPDAQTQMLYPQAQQAAPGPTLGQANGDPSGLPPGNPVLDQYTQAIGGMLNTLQQRGFIRPEMPPQPGPGILESLGTFGMANLKHIADENTRREQNYVIHKENQATALKGMDLATRMVDAQATAAGLAGRSGLAAQRLDLEQKRYIADLEQKLFTRGRMQVNDELKQDYIPAPMGADAIDAAVAGGYHPSVRFGSSWTRKAEDGGDAGEGGGGGGLGGGASPRLVKNPTTGAYELPRPGAPARSALDAVGGGDTGSAASGVPNTAALRGQKRQQEAAPAQTSKDVSSIDESLASVKRLRELAQDPEVQKWIGPTAGRGAMHIYKLGGAIPLTGVRLPDKVSEYIQKTSFLNAQATGPLLHGSRNAMVWRQIQQHLPKPHDTPQLALDKLKGIDEIYSKNRDVLLEDADLTRGGGGGQGATTDTPTSGGGPPSTVGGGTKPTPATGSTPGDLNSLLKKHGY